MKTQQLMTREAFERWCVDNNIRVGGTRMVPCTCRDLNCHGWRFEHTVDPPARVVMTTRRELRMVPGEHTY